MRVDRKGSFVLEVGLQCGLDAQDGGFLARAGSYAWWAVRSGSVTGEVRRGGQSR